MHGRHPGFAAEAGSARGHFRKGDIKYSGSIARGMDALNVVAIPNFTSPELYVEHVSMICEGVIDQAASYEMAKRSFALLKELEGWGVYFPLDKSGNYHTLQMGPKAAFITAMEEPDLKLIISRMAIDKGAKVINRVMGVSLMTEGERVTGAIGLNVRNGEMVACQAKARDHHRRVPGAVFPAQLRLPLRHFRLSRQLGRQLLPGLPGRGQAHRHGVLAAGIF